MAQSPWATALAIITIAVALVLVRSGLQSLEDARRPQLVPVHAVAPVASRPAPAAVVTEPGPAVTLQVELTGLAKSEIFQRMAQADRVRLASRPDTYWICDGVPC